MLQLDKPMLYLDKSIFILDAESVGALRANQMSIDEFGNIIFATRAEVYKNVDRDINETIDSHPVIKEESGCVGDCAYVLDYNESYSGTKTEINDSYLASIEKFNNLSFLDKKTIMMKHCAYLKLLRINSFRDYISSSFQDFTDGFIPYTKEILDKGIYYTDEDFETNVIVSKKSVDVENRFIIVKNKLLMILSKETIGDLLSGNTDILVNLYEEMLSKLISTNKNVYQNVLFYSYLKL